MCIRDRLSDAAGRRCAGVVFKLLVALLHCGKDTIQPVFERIAAHLHQGRLDDGTLLRRGPEIVAKDDQISRGHSIPALQPRFRLRDRSIVEIFSI